MPSLSAAHCLVEHPLRDHSRLDVLGLTYPPQPIERHLGATTGTAADKADRLIDHRPAAQRTSVRRLAPGGPGRDIVTIWLGGGSPLQPGRWR